jgi:hypothetical protein
MEPWLIFTLIFTIGFISGALFGIVVLFLINRKSDKQRKEYERQLLDFMKVNFSTLSADALNKSQNVFLNLAEQRLNTQTKTHTAELDSKKQLIDQ